MQPQSPVQYDFIVNPVKPPKRSFVSALTDGNPIVSIVIVITVVIVALIFFIIINSSLNKNTNLPKLTVVAQQQNELIRVATLATSNTTQGLQPTKDFSQNCLLSITTEQQRLISFLATQGTKLSTRELSLSKNSATDTSITNSIASGNFDSTFKGTMNTELTSYESAIKSASSTATTATEKQLLKDDYSATQLLLQQLNLLGQS